MRVLGTITQPETIRRILLCLGQRAEPLARAKLVTPPGSNSTSTPLGALPPNAVTGPRWGAQD
jgi:hypothetical protein